MIRFTSARERRLWIWTGLVVVTIFATIGLARTIAAELVAQDLLAVAFVAGMLLIAAAFAAQAFRTRPHGPEIGVLLAILAVYVLVIVRLASPVERSHLIEYSVVALLIYEALRERRGHGGRAPRPGATTFVATASLGALDEVIQLFIPARVFDPIDIVFNTTAAAMAVVASSLLAWVKRRGGSVGSPT